jgi:predicted nucleic acid-binding protein
MVIVSDTTAISNLFLIDKLWILEKLYGQIGIPPQVMAELEQLEQLGWDISPLQTAPWICVQPVSNLGMVLVLSDHLDKGEAEAIALAYETNADLLIIDEIKGRKYAQRLHLNITGLLGVLLEAKQENVISNVRSVLDELKEKAGFWLRQDLYTQILTMANEL